MLSENYKNALHGFKNPGQNLHASKGCELEAQHIYRIIMTEGVSVLDMDETMLESFIDKEKEGEVNYSLYADHDGFKFVNFEKDVMVFPLTGDVYFQNIEGQEYTLSAPAAQNMLEQLMRINKLSLISSTLQSLAQRADGTLLQTAMPSLNDMKECISMGLTLPPELVEKIKLWETMGCSIVSFDFEETK